MRRAGALALAAVMVCSLLPSRALAMVRVDETELVQGENAVGGGTVTLVDSTLDMGGVTADELYTDEDLCVRFNGGNDVEDVNVAGSAKVDLSFSGENDVEEVHSSGESDVTINANGSNKFEEIGAADRSKMTINVSGENEFEEIVGTGDASVTIRGTECQRRDVVNLGKGEKDTALTTERGTLVIDHATVNFEGEQAAVGSEHGDVFIDASKIAGGDDNKYVGIGSGGTMLVRESVVDIAGTMVARGQMTIEHSDVKVEKPDDEHEDNSPRRVLSLVGIDLIDEKNGEVREFEYNGQKAFCVDTGDGDDADLKADGSPAYYRCKGDSGEDHEAAAIRHLPRTGDGNGPLVPLSVALAGLALSGAAVRRMRADS